MSALIAKINNNELIICPSFENLAEIAFVYTHDKEKYLALYLLFCELVNADYIIRPINDIIVNDIVCFANLEITNYFMQPDEDKGWLLSKIRNKQALLSDDEIQKVCEDSMVEKETFRSNVLMAFSEVTRQEAKAKLKNEQRAGFDTISSFWRAGGTAENIATCFTEPLGLKDKCCEKGIGKLIEIPTIRVFIGYIINSWYRQVAFDAKEKLSSAYDFRHATCAGVTGNLVTRDKQFKNVIKNIPDLSIDLLSLDDLL